MTDYQVTNYGLCGECKHHKFFSLRVYDFMGYSTEDWYCSHKESKRSGQITAYTDTCEFWEGESDDKRRCDI